MCFIVYFCRGIQIIQINFNSMQFLYIAKLVYKSRRTVHLAEDTTYSPDIWWGNNAIFMHFHVSLTFENVYLKRNTFHWEQQSLIFEYQRSFVWPESQHFCLENNNTIWSVREKINLNIQNLMNFSIGYILYMSSYWDTQSKMEQFYVSIERI